jgi:tetratricopeptide (TPR) repeat protein
MQQTKTIKIFLGSSITELHYERLHLGDYLMNSVRPIFENDGIRVEVIKCEDIRSGNTGTPPQDKIDELLRNCDVSVFMFKEKAGKDTVHKFDVAQATQKTKRHEIYMYCFNMPKKRKKLTEEEEKDAKNLEDFQNRLKAERFYWYSCKDAADLESQFILGLLKYERQLLGMKPASPIEQESEIEKDGDFLFEEFELNKQKLHQKIDDLLQQTKTVMENEDDTIAERIFKVIELYKKADLWASKTDYDKEKYCDLLFDYAQFLEKYGLYRDAEIVYLRQIPLAEELYGAEHDNIATSYNNIGEVYRKQSDYGKAMEYYFKALEIDKKLLVEEHSDTATYYNNIGLVYHEQGDYDKALEYYQKALELYKKDFGTEHPKVALSYNNIGGYITSKATTTRHWNTISKLWRYLRKSSAKSIPTPLNLTIILVEYITSKATTTKLWNTISRL